MPGTLTVPETLLHQIEERARARGITIDAQAAELLADALSRDKAEEQLLAEIRKERDEMASRGVFLKMCSIDEVTNGVTETR
jgi:hypothetical protein